MRRILVGAAVFGLALALRWAPNEPIPPFDDLYHAKRIEFSAKHFPRVLDFDPDRGLAGAFCPWPPLYDLTCAALSHVVDVRWLPPVGFALFAAAIAGWWAVGGGQWAEKRSRLLRPPPTAHCPLVVAAGLALSPYLIGISRTSHIDHHWVEPMLMLAIVLATRARRGFALGIALAAALLVQPAFLVAAALAFVALFFDDAYDEGLRAFAVAAIAVVAYRLTRPHGYPDSAWFLGWPHAAVLIGAAAAFSYSVWRRQSCLRARLECHPERVVRWEAKDPLPMEPASSYRRGSFAPAPPPAQDDTLDDTQGERRQDSLRHTERPAALIIGALVALAFPHTATAFLTGSNFFGSDPWFSSIVEFQPMFHDRAAMGTDLANLTGGALLAVALIRRERTVALFAIAYFVLALTSRRFLVPGIPLFVLAGALAMRHARTRIAAIACAALTLIPPIAYDFATREDPWPNYDFVYRRAAAIRNLPPGRVLAPWSYGHAIDVIGEHPVILDNFGSTPNAMEFDDATFALHAGGRALERYVRAHGAIVVIPR